jgi:phospholipase C
MTARQSKSRRRLLAALAATTMLAGGWAVQAPAQPADGDDATTTPIKHVVVIYGENVSFDHYFATYPAATNPSGEPTFKARDDTPTVNSLVSAGLLTNNPNLAQPFRLDRSEAFTCSQDHNYTDEQKAFDGGLMDKFVQATGRHGSLGCRIDGSTVMGYYDGNTVTALWNYAQRFALDDNSYGTTFGPSTPGAINLISGQTGDATLVTFVSGKPSMTPSLTDTNDIDPAYDDCGSDHGGTVNATTLQLNGQNIGDLLNAKHLTWGWFEGGFAPTTPAVLNPDGSTKTPAQCNSAHLEHEYIPPGASTPLFVEPNPTAEDGGNGTDIHILQPDYTPHHEPFQYYASTRNPHHLRPTPDTPQEIGKSDQANHQYDISDFFNALAHGNLPAVSYLKAASYEEGHPGNSDPLTEQVFVVQVLNALQQSPFWRDTAVIINYDDSDGWYDHVAGPIINHSANLNVSVGAANLIGASIGVNNGTGDANDSLIPVLPLSTSTTPGDPSAITSSGSCGPAPTNAPPGAGRCGYGPRIPFMVISPWAKQNYIDHTLTDQTSSLRFIETNWNLGSVDSRPLPTGSFDQVSGSIMGMFDFDDPPNPQPLVLDIVTGEPTSPGRWGGPGRP